MAEAGRLGGKGAATVPETEGLLPYDIGRSMQLKIRVELTGRKKAVERKERKWAEDAKSPKSLRNPSTGVE